MSDDLGEVREHLARNDHRLDTLEATMESEAGLRAMLDQDQSSLKTQLAAQGKLMQAMATTQGEHSRLLTRLENKVAGVDDKVTNLDSKVTRLERNLEETKVGVLMLVGMFSKEERPDGDL